ncbi:hypothetical protein SAMN05192584_109140 [Streptomyces pini]|uniref:Uncharacterized protein n=2 Tax=Streptomyces TaxID=1883 RepID=A0A1I4CTK7_9ACTN|nr:hypothetical protein SAMN05192584_109140 [Streptomyces pini]
MSMTSPRSTYGGGYYSAPSFADTPIYDSLVAERGTPQIAPIRVPASPYETSDHLPALPAALPALPSGPSYQPQPARSYPAPAYQQPAPVQQPAPLQQAPAPYIPQQAAAPRGGYGYPQQPQPQQMRPVAARPVPAQSPYPGSYEESYGHSYQGRGY